jgi:hypothetical protein
MTAEEWDAYAESRLPQRTAVVEALTAAGFKTLEWNAYGAYRGIQVYASKNRKYVDLFLIDKREVDFLCIVNWGHKIYPPSLPPEGIVFSNRLRAVLTAAGLESLVHWAPVDELNRLYRQKTGIDLRAAPPPGEAG